MKNFILSSSLFVFMSLIFNLKVTHALDVQTFRPLNMSQGGFSLYDAEAFKAKRLSLALYYNFDKHPLEFGLNNTSKLADVVNDLHTANLIASYEFNKNIALNLDLPYQYLTDFEDISSPLRTEASSLGDLLVSLPIYLGKLSKRLSLKIVPKLVINTGNNDPFVGSEDVLFGLGLALDRKTKRSRWTVNADYQSREEETLYNLVIGNRLKLGFGYTRDIGDLKGFLWVNEITQELPIGVNQNQVNSPAEFFTGFRHVSQDEDIIWNIGYSKGLNHGYGSPDYRLFAGINYVFSRYKKERVKPILAPVVDTPVKVIKEVVKKPSSPPLVIALEKIHFITNSAKIKSDSYSVLSRLVRLLKQHKEIESLRIQGHTDSRGAEAYNVDLSKRRALSVKKFLVANGIDVSRLSSTGIGPHRPIDTNATREGRYNNRRVEFKVLRISGTREIIFKRK